VRWDVERRILQNGRVIVTLRRRVERCPICDSDEQVIGRGLRYNKSGPVQLYYCKSCKKKFRDRRMLESKIRAIMIAWDLHHDGLSYRKIAKHLRSYHEVKVNHATVYNWIRRFSHVISRLGWERRHLHPEERFVVASIVATRGEERERRMVELQQFSRFLGDENWGV